MICRSIAVLLVAAIVSSACSSDDSSGGPSSTVGADTTVTASSIVAPVESPSATTTPTTPAPTTTESATSAAPSTAPPPPTQPPATDVAAVTPVYQALIDRYDAAVDAILLDPRVAADASSAEVVAYLALFEEGNTFASGTLDFWASEGDAGKRYLPGPRGRMYESTVKDVSAGSADEATFTVCSLRSIVVVNADGVEQSAEGGFDAGSVSVVRVDGVWLLRDLTRIAPDACPDPREQ